MLEKFWQDNLKEIRENKIRFTAICFCFVLAIILFISEDSDGEEIILEEVPEFETVEVAENVSKKVVAVKNAANSDVDENIKIVFGANSQDLFIQDPFKFQLKEEITPTPEISSVEIAPPPLIQIPTEKIILRGIVIAGINKSALVQKGEENFILEIGDKINDKIIFGIDKDFLILDDGTKIFIDTN